MSFYKEVPGRKTTLESVLKFDIAPTEGSTNPVTSDGVKSAIDGAVGDASAALQEQIDEIAEKAGSGYIPKGEADVAALNGLSGQENGWLYTMTDAGTLTDGSLAVSAGDTVAWDEANSVWYKAMDYAPRQYGTNEVHNLATTITAFRTGDVIPVDGPSGTAKMGKDDLLKETAQWDGVIDLFAIQNSRPAGMSNGDYYYHTSYKTEIQKIAGTDVLSLPLKKDSGVYLLHGVPFTYNGTELVCNPSAGGKHIESAELIVGKCVRTGNTIGATLNLVYEADNSWSCFVRKVNKGDEFVFRMVNRNTSVNYQFACFTDNDLKITSFDYEYASFASTFVYDAISPIGNGNIIVRMIAPNDGYLVCNASNAQFGQFTQFYTGSFAEINSKLSDAYNTAHTADTNASTALSRSTVKTYENEKDVSSSAIITDGQYMKNDGTLVYTSYFCTIEIPISGFDTIKFTGKFNRAVSSSIQLDSSNNVVKVVDEDKSGTLTILINLEPTADKIVFNCGSHSFTAFGMDAVDVPVNEYAEGLGESVAELLSKSGDSVFNRHHDFGLVPTGKYKGLLTDYTWGDAATQYSEVITKYDELLIPNYSYKENIGQASNNADMYVYKFTPQKCNAPSGYSKGFPTIMFICAQHGFEKNSTFGMYHFLKDLITNYDKNELLRYIRANVNLYVVPVANPWGFNSSNYWNANQVNLNRNWDVPNWTKTYDPDNPRQNSGDAPFDQPETANIRDFILENSDIDFLVDHHTNGGSNVSTRQDLNWIDTTTCGNDSDVYYNRVKEIATYHGQSISELIREIAGDTLLGISGTEGENLACAKITWNNPFPSTGFADAYAITQGIMANTLEGFAGFLTGTRYNPESKQCMAAIEGNWIQAILYNLGK